MTRVRMLTAGVLVAALLLAGCGDDDSDTDTAGSTDTTAAASESGVTITDVWSRATAPTAENGAVYFTVTAAEDDALVGAAVDPSIADDAQVHETVAAEGDDMSGDMSGTTMGGDGEGAMDGAMDGTTDTSMGGDMSEGMGGMTMQEVDQVELPAGEAVTFEPGGYHVMLFGLDHQLVAGDTFEVTLQFEVAGEQTVTAEVRDM